MLYYERKLKKQGFKLIIGVDEAGRGPLAGPVVAAAVLLNTYRFKNRIDDSKKLTSGARERSFFEIIRKSEFEIGVVDELVIDRINILQATRLAMCQAVNALAAKLGLEGNGTVHIIVDGKMNLDIRFSCTDIIKGDARSKSIASASILAKVTRDRMMDSYHKLYPQYGFDRHKGYPTKAHRLAINKEGLSPIHRKSFSIC